MDAIVEVDLSILEELPAIPRELQFFRLKTNFTRPLSRLVTMAASGIGILIITSSHRLTRLEIFELSRGC